MTKFEEQKLMLMLLTRSLRHDVLNALTVAMNWRAIERTVKIVKNLKTFEEEVIDGRLGCINVREVIEDVAKHFDVPITIQGECEVVADHGLRAIFENMFQNAIQHGKTDRTEVIIEKVNNFCEIRVIDYGKGIPDEIKDKIFEEGFTYGNSAGTGIGLYLVKKLVERYGGEIRVENNYPKGTVFVLRLKAFS